MPAIKKIAKLETYAAIEAQLLKDKHENACGPVALAILAGITLDTAIETCKRHKWNPAIGMTMDNLKLCFKEHGFKCQEVSIPAIIATYPKGYRDGIKNVTTHHPRRFPETFANRNLLLFVKRHFVAIKDGATQCYSINNTLRALAVYEILPLQGKK